jgi:hypothetical protein
MPREAEVWLREVIEEEEVTHQMAEAVTDKGNLEVVMEALQEEEVMDNQEEVLRLEEEVDRHHQDMGRLKVEPTISEINRPLQDIEDHHQRGFQFQITQNKKHMSLCSLCPLKLKVTHPSDQKKTGQALRAPNHLRLCLVLLMQVL